MNNRDIYQQDPSQKKLVNEGVANVNDDRSGHALAVLRYELETFVCEGQYNRGMGHILDTYLRNLGQAQQPGVWVSGFYGSGKSHLVKMLRALWVDTRFPDGATARGIASHLSYDILDRLRELSTQAKRLGRLHAASGTLGAGAEGSVRLALLGIVFKSVGLPERYPLARFVLWLQKEGMLDAVRERVEQQGADWLEELDNLYVSDLLYTALMEAKPNLFDSMAACANAINNLFPSVQDVSNDEMLKALQLALTEGKQFPLTLIVLDEVQQYVDDGTRSLEVQEVVEACCKGIGSKLLFVATGQTAVTGTANLRKLEGRFTVRVELSDADVHAVVRQVVLDKKPGARAAIDQVVKANLGEISRHLAGSGIAHRREDVERLITDYPILPVRWRFWERTLRVLDQTGTKSQLRNQLGMIHKVIRDNLDQPLGHVIPGDALYFDLAATLLQHRILPRRVHDETMTWMRGSDWEQQLTARACGLVFLINKLSASNEEAGVRASTETLADLLVEHLAEGSGPLRAVLPRLLNRCELLMQVGDEYRIRTEESTAWNDEFLRHSGELASESYRIDAERGDRLRRRLGERLKKLTVLQGDCKVERKIQILFDTRRPEEEELFLWVQEGWVTDEASVRAEARAAGNGSPLLFAFVPKRSADDLRRCLIDYKAAEITLERRGLPNTAEGVEARAAMETTRHNADSRIRALLDEALSGMRVFQGGGNEVVGEELQEVVLEAAEHAIHRLYPQFSLGDHAAWGKVYDKAKAGAADALKSVGHEGEAATHGVCKAILGYLGSSKSGKALRNHFEGKTYGWSRDTVDGGLQVLLTASLVRASDEYGKAIAANLLERNAIGKTLFRAEAVSVSTAQRIQIRRLMQKVGCVAKQGEEVQTVPVFLQRLQELAERAGGDPPKPAPADTTLLAEVRAVVGNEQLLILYTHREELEQAVTIWNGLAEKIALRWPAWELVVKLLQHAEGLKGVGRYQIQADEITSQRLLLGEPDAVAPLLAGLSQLLREEANRLLAQYQTRHAEGMARLRQDSHWERLEARQRYTLQAEAKLTESERPNLELGSPATLLTSLERLPLTMLSDRVAALSRRFDQVLEGAASVLEPQARTVMLPKSTVSTEAELEQWLEGVRQQLKQALAEGPVMIR
ncbi:MAG: BREX system P-loop protein BrxC [Magnetococcales bacterium]|nr:BREX system P-loop protein BrxC [Magnetococcales bacterium]MBF0115933.1 BREX system P-loop protein BrxC [Magnetococcales bacterium]